MGVRTLIISDFCRSFSFNILCRDLFLHPVFTWPEPLKVPPLRSSSAYVKMMIPGVPIVCVPVVSLTQYPLFVINKALYYS